MGVVYAINKEGDPLGAYIGAEPADVVAMPPAQRAVYGNGHYHIWPMRPWYQIRIARDPRKGDNDKTAMGTGKWERRPAQGGPGFPTYIQGETPFYPPLSEIMEPDPRSLDPATGLASLNSELPGLRRRLVFKWMARDIGEAGYIPAADLTGVQGVNVPWSPTEGLAYPTSRSGTNQPETCYIYSLDPKYETFTGDYTPSRQMQELWAWEDAHYGKPANDEERREMLKDGRRTPRDLLETQLPHLDRRPGVQDQTPGQMRRLVFIVPGPSAPEGVPKSQRFYKQRGRGGQTQSLPQGLQYVYRAWKDVRPDKSRGVPVGYVRTNSGIQRNCRVLMVDVSHILADSTLCPWALFKDDAAQVAGLRPAFEQRQSRKLQIHKLNGGLNPDKLSPADKAAFEARLAAARAGVAGVAVNADDAEEAAAAAVAQQPAAALAAGPAGAADADEAQGQAAYNNRYARALMNLRYARERVRMQVERERRRNGADSVSDEQLRARMAAAVAAASQAYAERKPETLYEMIWRPTGLNNKNSAGSALQATEAQDATYTTWRNGRLAEGGAGLWYPNGVPVERPRGCEVKADVAAKWPLLRKTPESTATHNGVNDTGVDISTIPGPGETKRLLAPNEVTENNIEVVTFATVQSCVPSAEWEEYVLASEVTSEVLDKCNRWSRGGPGGGGGVPSIWKLSNFENPDIIHATAGAAGATAYSPGVASLFGTAEKRAEVQQYDSQVLPAWLREKQEYDDYIAQGGYAALLARDGEFNHAVTLYTVWYQSLDDSLVDRSKKRYRIGSAHLPHIDDDQWALMEFEQGATPEDWTAGEGADAGYSYPPTPLQMRPIPHELPDPDDNKPQVPSVTGGVMKTGQDGQSQAPWGEVELVDHLRDRSLSAVYNMVTDAGLPPVAGATPGLLSFPHIAKLGKDMHHGNKDNNVYVVPYALYNKADYDRLAGGDAEEQARNAARAAAVAAAQQREQQLAAEAAQRAADLAAEQAAAAAQAADQQAQEEQAQRNLEAFQADRAQVAEWRSTRTVNPNPATNPPWVGWFNGVTYRGRPIRDYSDRDWWNLYKQCKDVPRPGPAPGADTGFDGLNGNGRGGDGGGIRYEGEARYKARLKDWTDEPNPDLKLPWQPEQHEAPYDLYARLSGVRSQVSCTLLGDRGKTDFESAIGASGFTGRQENWRTFARNADKIRAEACKAIEEREAARVAREAAEAAEAERQATVAAQIAQERARREEEEARLAAGGASAAGPSAPAVKRKRSGQEVLADDEAPGGDDDVDPKDLFGDSDDDEFDFGPPTAAAIDNVHWTMLGGVGMGHADSMDTLRLSVATASQERFQSAWTAAGADERLALIHLRSEGQQLVKEQTERLQKVTLS